MSDSEELAVVSRSDSQGPILPLASPEAMAEAMRAYEALKRALLTENDEQEITVKGKNRKFTKRQGWRKLSIAFGVSTTILDRKITAGPEGRTLSAEFTVRATAPNGRFADGWGACSAWEERFQDDRGRQKMEHDIPATAETRAENRAAANLFGYGEVSAEEMEDAPGVAKPACPNCGKPVRESTFNAGEWYCWTKQGGCGWKGTAPAMADTVDGDGVIANPSAASREAVAGAVGVSAPSVGGPAPMATSPDERAGRSERPAGPRAKRQNVVQAPQRAEEAGKAAAATAPANPAAVAPQSAEPLDAPLDGKEEYLANLRELARQVAAVVVHLRVKLTNKKNEAEIALGNATAKDLPPLKANPDSDASLTAFITATYPGRTLADLGEAELEGTEEKPGVIRTLEGIVERIHKSGVHE